jgi:hypothetical protein
MKITNFAAAECMAAPWPPPPGRLGSSGRRSLRLTNPPRSTSSADSASANGVPVFDTSCINSILSILVTYVVVLENMGKTRIYAKVREEIRMCPKLLVQIRNLPG